MMDVTDPERIEPGLSAPTASHGVLPYNNPTEPCRWTLGVDHKKICL